jgi:parallel beta-helix repeat protein
MGLLKNRTRGVLGAVILLWLFASRVQPSFTGPVGPQLTITCPAGAITIAAGSNNTQIQSMVDNNAAGSTFCFKAGVFPFTGPVRPKSGDTFVGEYGAILDGSDWWTTTLEMGAFRAHNEDINNVTIRNLVIRGMPQRAIHTYSSGFCENGRCTFSTAGADGWVIENNEIHHSTCGVQASNGMIIRNNYIHHNVGQAPFSDNDRIRGGGFENTLAQNVLFDNNEVAYNGPMQKAASLSPNTTFRNNFVHHNIGSGIWYDGENPGALIENNTVEDNGSMGIFYEVSGSGIIRGNIIRRSGDNGMLIATSHNVEVYNNTLIDNFRGINFFINCDVLASHPEIINEPFDLQNVSAHDNTIVVGTRPGSWANAFSQSNCTSTQWSPYLFGSKSLTFSRNAYYVPILSSGYWSHADRMLGFSQWQAIPQDANGTVHLSSEYVPNPGTPTCDLSGDGSLNVLDVQLCANQTLGVISCGTGDINRDGTCTVTDVQRVINAVLGSACLST